MFATAFQNVLVLLLLAVPAFIIAKLKMIKTKETVSVLSILLLYVCTPFITINAFLRTNFEPQIIINLLLVDIITIILMLIIIGLVWLASIKMQNRDAKGVLAYLSSCGNVGFMAIPFLQILTNNNSEIILYATASVVAFNLITWTVGCYLLTGDRKHISIKNAFLNPPTLTFLIVLPFFIFNINFINLQWTEPLANVSKLFADMTGPLSMSILGILFSQIKFKELFLDYKVYLVSAVKLLISPLIAFGIIAIFSLFVDIEGIRLNIIVLASMPAANNILMFCTLYNKDANFASKVVLISTILSIITIPLAIKLLV